MQVLKKTWNVISTVLVIIVVILTVALVGVRLFGLQVYTVLSGSMEPTYKTGSIIYVRDVDYKTLEVNDPVTFLLDEDTVATHRIVEIIPDEENQVIRYRTKGDANETVDGKLLHCNNILGKPVFHIPYLGYIVNYIQHPPGMYIVISAGAIVLVLMFLPNIFANENKSSKKDENSSVKDDDSN